MKEWDTEPQFYTCASSLPNNCLVDECDKIPATMKIISIGFVAASEVPQPRRHTPWNNWFFEHEEGVVDQDGEIMCPICGCCSLKQVSFSETTKQSFRMTGDLVWVCASGCTKTKPHRGC